MVGVFVRFFFRRDHTILRADATDRGIDLVALLSDTLVYGETPTMSPCYQRTVSAISRGFLREFT